jgi:hypothetical protein
MMNDTQVLIKKMKLKGVIMCNLSYRSTVSLTPYFLSCETPIINSKLSEAFAQRVGELAFRYGGKPIGSSVLLESNLKRVYGESMNTILDIKSALDPNEIMNPPRFS